jgi:hypothetical protein
MIEVGKSDAVKMLQMDKGTGFKKLREWRENEKVQKEFKSFSDYLLN